MFGRKIVKDELLETLEIWFGRTRFEVEEFPNFLNEISLLLSLRARVFIYILLCFNL